MSDGLKIYSSIWRPQIQLSMAVGCLIMKIPIQISGTCHKQNVNIRAEQKKLLRKKKKLLFTVVAFPVLVNVLGFSVMFDSFTMLCVENGQWWHGDER